MFRDELIVRVYEWTGQSQENVALNFPAQIVSAREVSGLEDPVGDVAFNGRQLTFTAVVRHAKPSTGDMAIILQQRKHPAQLTDPPN